MRTTFLSLAAAAIALSTISAPAPAPAQEQQARVEGRAAAEAMRKLLNEHYVLPELRPKFAEVLSAGIASGRYDVAEVDELVKRLNADLAKVTTDKHLVVQFDPAALQRQGKAVGLGSRDLDPLQPAIGQATIHHGTQRAVRAPASAPSDQSRFAARAAAEGCP